MTLVLPGSRGASLSSGLLRSRYKVQHAIEKATIKLDRKDFALEDAGGIVSEIFLDATDLAASGGQVRVLEIPLPAAPALSGIGEIAVVFGSIDKRTPLDVSFTAFEFVP